MRRDFKKKRFFISIILLLCGAFALYPYLSGGAKREVIRHVSGLEDRELALSVIKNVMLADSLTDRRRTLPLSQMREQVTKLRNSLASLKKELAAMPEKSSQLTEAAESALHDLEGSLTEFIKALPESGDES